jgi:hypothetical protein
MSLFRWIKIIAVCLIIIGILWIMLRNNAGLGKYFVMNLRNNMS